MQYSGYRYGEWERKKQLQKSIENRQNFIIELIMVPCIMLGPFLIVYLMSMIMK
jgi:hypothetical protein